ncbi:MAG TPA: hypothetical protein VI278_02760 [Nitrososphaeraceae archaeon]
MGIIKVATVNQWQQYPHTIPHCKIKADKWFMHSGYISTRKEKPCSYYPHSGYRREVQWMLDLKNIKHETNGSNLFDASMTPVSDISNGGFSIVINPFGEAYPELGNGGGVGFKTIASYIRDGGIFINSGGQSFAYSWDVNTGNSQLLVNFIPALSDIQTDYIEGIPILQSAMKIIFVGRRMRRRHRVPNHNSNVNRLESVQPHLSFLCYFQVSIIHIILFF